MRLRKTSILLIAALVVAGFAVVALLQRAGVSIASTTRSRGSSSADAGNDSGGSAAAEDPTRANGRADASAVQRASAPTFDATAWLDETGVVEAPSCEGGLPVAVKLKRTGEPAAGVPVLALETDGSFGTPELLRFFEHPAELRKLRVELHRTDAHGVTRVPLFSRFEFVIAASGTLRAARRIESPPLPPIELELQPAASLRARVVDRGGAPLAGVPLVFGFSFKGQFEVNANRRATTGADGTAVFTDTDLRSRHHRDLVWQVAVDGPMLPKLAAVFDPEHPPDDPIPLVLGDAGAIEFQLVDDGGRPLALDGDAWFEVMTADSHHEWNAQTPLRAGRARLAPVGLGLDWTFQPHFAERSAEDAHGHGPVRDEETLAVAVPIHEPGPVVVGLLREVDGTPASDASLLAVHYRTDDEGSGYEVNRKSARADQEGRFRVDLHDVRLESRRRALWLVATADTAHRARRAWSALPPRLQQEVIDVGELRLEPDLPTLSGRVVDESQRPIPNARVEIDPLDFRATKGDYERRGDPLTRSAADGSFAIFGWPPGRYSVFWNGPSELMRPGGNDAKPTFELPQQDVTLSLVPAAGSRGCILGSVLLDVDDDLRESLTVQFRRRGASDAPASVPVDRRGCIAFLAPPPGTYDATLTIESVGDPRDTLLHVDGIEAKQDAVVLDPRLQAIDLRGIVREVVVTVLDPQGAPTTDAIVRAYFDDAPVAGARLGLRKDRKTRFLTTQPVLEVEAIGPRGSYAHQRVTTRDVELRLARGQPILANLELHSGRPLAMVPFVVYAAVLPAGPVPEDFEEWSTTTFDYEGAAIVPLPRAGDWTVRVFVGGGNSHSPGDWSDAQLVEPLTVPEGATEVHCSIHMPLGMLDDYARLYREH